MRAGLCLDCGASGARAILDDTAVVAEVRDRAAGFGACAVLPFCIGLLSLLGLQVGEPQPEAQGQQDGSCPAIRPKQPLHVPPQRVLRQEFLRNFHLVSSLLIYYLV
jgi:hypothetical protein